jgi:uncharacterized membrane protein
MRTSPLGIGDGMPETEVEPRKDSTRRSITGPAVLLGIGLGGLFDGIVLHQILQWHHMLTSHGDFPATTVRGLEVNTLWDGLFHAATYVVVTVGLFMLWDRVRWGGIAWSWRALTGWMLVGWGSFNLVEGVVDHHILQIHHVRSGPNELAWDLAFLGLGAVLFAIGWSVGRSESRRAAP